VGVRGRRHRAGWRPRVADVVSRLPAFPGRGRAVLWADRRLTDPDDPASYLAVGRVNDEGRLVLDLRLFTQKFAYYYRRLERDAVRAARAWFRGGVFVDVGASVGLWTVAVATRAREVGGSVCAVEPVPHHRARLAENLRLNAVADLVEVVPCALGSTAGGEVRLVANPLGAADNARIDPAGPVRAPLRTLDDLADERGWDDVDLVKVDCEGYDAEVLLGGERTLRRFRPVVFAELLREHASESRTAAARSLLVDALDYAVGRVVGRRFRPLAGADEENVVFVPRERLS
jgi:FkbM family methyltransferase